MRVALIGTGRMGSAMGARIAGAGHDLTVFNRTRSRAEDVARSTGVQVADTARDAAASAEICLVSLADDAAVTATYLADDGLIGGMQPGAVVCELSTVAPATVRGLSPLVAQRGATLIDTPVSGSVSVVESGTLTVMVGGDQAALDRARPVLETFAKSIFHLGDVGAGAIMKYKRAAFLQPGEIPVAFSLSLVAKDQELIHDLAQQTGARMDQGEASRQIVAEALGAQMGERDISEVAEFLRRF